MAKRWEVKEKVFIVTGGASGLGAAYTEAFLKEGAMVCFNNLYSSHTYFKYSITLNNQCIIGWKHQFWFDYWYFLIL